MCGYPGPRVCLVGGGRGGLGRKLGALRSRGSVGLLHRLVYLIEVGLAFGDIGRLVGVRLLWLGSLLRFGGEEHFSINAFGACSGFALFVDFHSFDIDFNTFSGMMWFDLVAANGEIRLD
ncbi:spermidine synthase [Striga asiatica]|uniref:Spermidine synthase n=1 Tax=Striga asiatica TaxID=4170 RepID=A0A5A7P1D3_STRAF|nr:spermidine synthase [Striga asiatica]